MKVMKIATVHCPRADKETKARDCRSCLHYWGEDYVSVICRYEFPGGQK